MLIYEKDAKDYGAKAKEYHNCGLELSKLYNELRIFKTLNANSSIEEIKMVTLKISDDYQRILEKHENHELINNDLFKSKSAKYFELTKLNVIKIKFE
ncbi:hypothetical protein ACNQGP_15295 [Flavobacterium sp. GT2N3]|uniref:hypothetical protein n=1 Tax=unclassified Flavobacterium TaxID=196869 RepID=UPI003AAD4A88